MATILAKHIIGFGERDKWEQSIAFLDIDAQKKLKKQTPKLSEAKREVAESLVSVIEKERATTSRWENKYKRIVKSEEVTQYVFTFYPQKCMWSTNHPHLLVQ